MKTLSEHNREFIERHLALHKLTEMSAGVLCDECMKKGRDVEMVRLMHTHYVRCPYCNYMGIMEV